MQTHKQIAFRNQNVAGYIRNPISSIASYIEKKNKNKKKQKKNTPKYMKSYDFLLQFVF